MTDYSTQRDLSSSVLPNVKTLLTLGCDAVFVDFDGLLIDTEYAGWRSWNEVYKRYGVRLEISEWAQWCGGESPRSLWQEVQKFAAVELDWDQLERARRARRDAILTVLPGVHQFLDRCHQQGQALAIVSNSPLTWILRQMAALGLDSSVFDLIVPAADHQPKPAPAGYRIALAELGLSPERVVAFEDSTRGLYAAKAAGLRCVVVPNRVTVYSEFACADAVIPSLSAADLVPLKNAAE